MQRSIKFYAVPGERGFPQHIIREHVSHDGVIHRQMIATCNEAKYAGDVINRLNASEICSQEH